MSIGVGITLHPDRAFLRHTAPIVEQLVDYIEISPETLWGLEPVADFFAQVQQRSGLPFVAHGLGLSLGTPGAPDWAHLDRIRADHERFDFAWYSEHLGFWRAGDRAVGLALPLPHSDEAIQTVADNLAAMRQVVPVVAFENWAGFFTASASPADPAFFSAIQQRSGASMLLDLHNVQTHCLNTGCDPDRYIDDLELSRVIEIHMAGGSHSDPHWLRSGRVFRMDSHDDSVTDWQWRTLERILPRCTGLKGVTIERLPVGLAPEEVAGFVEEFERLKQLLGQTRVRDSTGPGVSGMVAWQGAGLADYERQLLLSLDGVDGPEGLDPDGVRMTALIVQKLRFQRLQTDQGLSDWFIGAPQTFMEAFRAYHRQVPPRFVFAADEVAAFHRWQRD